MKDKNDIHEKFLSDIGKYKKVIKMICYEFAYDRSYAYNDLYQEIMTNLWIGYRKGVTKDKLFSWVYTVALNTARLHSQKDKYRRNILKKFDEENYTDSRKVSRFSIEDLDNYLSEEDKYIFHGLIYGYSVLEISEKLQISRYKAEEKVKELKNKLFQIIERIKNEE